jgi:hemoglobin-like flavoprotein
MFFFVSRLFEILPETKAIFHYDENDSNRLTKLRNHIKLLFDTIGMAVDFIDDLGSLTPVIIQLGTRHHFYGVKQEYYLVWILIFFYKKERLKMPKG